MKSLKGQLLLASARLLDPNFARAVILLVHHDESGALGLILNRPLTATIQEVCQSTLQLPCAVEGQLHQGGPCEGTLMAVSTHGDASQVEVLEGVHFTQDRNHIESLLLNEYATMKYFVGYAGWSAGQLEGELEAGAWLTAAAEKDHVFSTISGEEFWSKIVSRLTLGKWIDPARIPDDPNVN